MSIGTDIKDVWAEVGISFTILRDSGNVSGEYGDAEVNAQITKPFVREFFLEMSLAYDTDVMVGDVLEFSDGRKYLAMTKTGDVFEDETYLYSVVLYKSNAQGNIFRLSSSRDAGYQSVSVWTAIKRDCDVLLTESFFGNELELDEPIGNLARESHDLYISHNRGLRENDRFDVSEVASGSSVTDAGTIDSTLEILVAGGLVDETWTVTFTSATEFGVAGATTGSVGTGEIGAEFDASPYFVIPASFFTGTWAIDETYVFATTAEYYRVTEIKTRRYAAVDLATLEEDTR